MEELTFKTSMCCHLLLGKPLIMTLQSQIEQSRDFTASTFCQDIRMGQDGFCFLAWILYQILGICLSNRLLTTKCMGCLSTTFTETKLKSSGVEELLKNVSMGYRRNLSKAILTPQKRILYCALTCGWPRHAMECTSRKNAAIFL